ENRRTRKIVRRSRPVSWLEILYEDEMTAAVAPDPQKRTLVLGILRQSRRLPSVPDFLAIDRLNNIPGPETCLRGRRSSVEIEHDRTLHLTGNFEPLPEFAVDLT